MFLQEKKGSRRHPQLLDPSRSALIIIDIQTAFGEVIECLDQVAERTAILAQAATRLNVPIWVTEQYPRALGNTLPAITRWLGSQSRPSEKLAFSAGDLPDLMEEIKESRVDQIVICGVETHVCVLQSALDMQESLGAQVCVVRDATASRFEVDRDAGLARLLQIGIQVVTTEMVIFEWLRKAGTPEFKELQALIK